MAPFKPRWTKTESKVVQEWIEQDSYSRPLGRFVRCPTCCYSRGCPLASYIYFGLFGCAAFCVLCMLCVMIVHPYVHSLKFKEATCVALSKEYVGEKTCSCGSNCRSTYSCLHLKVRMTMPDGQMVDTEIYQTTSNMMEAHPCAYNPVCSLDPKETEQDLSEFKQQYGRKLKKFSCLYNPYKPSQVVVHKMKDNSAIIHAVLWPFLGFLICAVATVVTFFICGCKFVCIGSPPSEIRDEARRRDQGRLWNDRRMSDEQQYLPVQRLEEEGKLDNTSEGPGEAYNPGKTCSYHEAMQYGAMRSIDKDVINEGMIDNVSDVADESGIPDGASDGKCSEV